MPDIPVTTVNPDADVNVSAGPIGGVALTHEEKLTLLVDINLPGHDARVTTPLFRHSRQDAFARDGGRCFVCNRTEAELGQSLESHHWIIERSCVNAADWTMARETIFKLEKLIGYAADFARNNPELPDIMAFTDLMTANGMLLCREHHTAPGTGIHTMPFPLWLVQTWGREGFQFTRGETLEHADDAVLHFAPAETKE